MGDVRGHSVEEKMILFAEIRAIQLEAVQYIRLVAKIQKRYCNTSAVNKKLKVNKH